MYHVASCWVEYRLGIGVASTAPLSLQQLQAAWHYVAGTSARATWQELLDVMRLRPLLCYLALAACYEDPGDLYDLLNISPQANPQEVKKAYRALSLKHHPGGLQP